MQLLNHVAKHHTDIQSKTKDIQLEEEALEKDPLEELEAELSSLKKELSKLSKIQKRKEIIFNYED